MNKTDTCATTQLYKQIKPHSFIILRDGVTVAIKELITWREREQKKCADCIWTQDGARIEQHGVQVHPAAPFHLNFTDVFKS